MSTVNTATKTKRFLVTYKGERQFFNVADHDEAARIMYRGLLVKQFGAEKKAKQLAIAYRLHESLPPGVAKALADVEPFEADADLASFVTFKRLAVTKESLRY